MTAPARPTPTSTAPGAKPGPAGASERGSLWIAVAVIGALLGGAVASCARARSPRASYEQIDARKDDIRDLWMQIRGWRVEIGMSPDPDRHLVQMVRPRSVSDLRVCPSEPHTRTCQDVCNLKDAICDNAARICHIADELGDDSWADEKCASAKASCKEARQRCCRCAASEPPK